MICPICESTNVIELEEPDEYKCLDCGYKFGSDEVLEDRELREKMDEEEESGETDEENEEEEEEDGGLFI